MADRCYNCGAPATTSEHAPPECFFPEGYNTGLFEVPSCDYHNLRLSTDVEYARNIICQQWGTNLVSYRVAETARASFEHSPNLFTRTFESVQPLLVAGEETGSFRLDMPRFNRVIKAIAFAMYYHDFGKRNEGDFDIFSTSLYSQSTLYHGTPDGYENLRGRLCNVPFKSMPVPQPKVFKHGMARLGEGQIIYRFEFYEAFVVYALTLPHRLSRQLYLPVTSDLTIFRLGRE
jgi:hypothetical protein